MNENQKKESTKDTSSKDQEGIIIDINRDASEKDQEPEERPLEKMNRAELREKIKELVQEKQANFDLYLRAQAEMENIKKRARKEKEDWLKYANENLIKEILPVMDNLEKALSHTDNEESFNALKEGVELTLKGLKDTLKKLGLEEVQAQGETFDPCFHEAVSEIEDNSVKAGAVVHELQKGYILNQRLIRPAMVVVSRGGENDTIDDNNNTEKACENN